MYIICIYIAKYNLLSPYNPILVCMISDLTFRYKITNRCAFPQRRLFLTFSAFLSYPNVCIWA